MWFYKKISIHSFFSNGVSLSKNVFQDSWNSKSWKHVYFFLWGCFFLSLLSNSVDYAIILSRSCDISLNIKIHEKNGLRLFCNRCVSNPKISLIHLSLSFFCQIRMNWIKFKVQITVTRTVGCLKNANSTCYSDDQINHRKLKNNQKSNFGAKRSSFTLTIRRVVINFVRRTHSSTGPFCCNRNVLSMLAI